MRVDARESVILVEAPPLAACEVCVIVPVRNERAVLASTLRALTGQTELDGRPLDSARYEIIVLANNCRDDSAAVARAVGQARPDATLHVVELTLPKRMAHVGRARQLLMDEAARRFALLGRRRGLIASTDADTTVTPTWLAATLGEIELGADAVGGRICTNLAGRQAWPAPLRAQYLRDVGYQQLVAELESRLDPDPADPWPRHYQHTGASLAVTAEAYRRAGGLPALPASEDLALYRALIRSGAAFRHSPAVRVITSTRRRGRAAGGMAAQLRAWGRWDADEAPRLVESVASLEARLRTRRRLRWLWAQTQLERMPPPRRASSIAAELSLPVDRLIEMMAGSGNWGALMEQVHDLRPAAPPSVEIATAIAELRSRLANPRRHSPATCSAFEQVEPVQLFALTVQMPQPERQALFQQEGLMNLVPGQWIVGDLGGPVDQEQMPS